MTPKAYPEPSRSWRKSSTKIFTKDKKSLMFVGLFLVLILVVNFMGVVSAQEDDKNSCWAVTSYGNEGLSGHYGYDEATRGELIQETNTYSGMISKENCQKLYNENRDNLNNQICASSGIIENVSIEWGSEVINSFELDCSATCSETDNGRDIYTKGTITKKSGNYEDYFEEDTCVVIYDNDVAIDDGKTWLNENFCLNNQASGELIKCGHSCFDGRCLRAGEAAKGIDEALNEAISELFNKSLICDGGCKLGDTCVPVSYRTPEEYCAPNNEFASQFQGGEQCNNGFECGSNVCVSGQCVEPGLIQKILDFFRNLFS